MNSLFTKVIIPIEILAVPFEALLSFYSTSLSYRAGNSSAPIPYVRCIRMCHWTVYGVHEFYSEIDFIHCQERMKSECIYPPYIVGPLRLFIDHSWFRKCQEGQNIANPVTHVFLKRTAQAVFSRFFHPPQKHHSLRRNIVREKLGSISKSNLRGITLLVRPICRDKLHTLF